MALVLMSHAGFYSVGMPKFDDFMAHPLGAPLKIIYESFFHIFVADSGVSRLLDRVRLLLWNFISVKSKNV